MASSDQLAGQALGQRHRLVVLLGLMLVMPISNPSLAQTTTSGALVGVVTDPSNAVVPNANVEIKDNSRSTHQSTKTDREGVYRFFFVAPERYTLTVSHDGFRTESRVVNVLLGPPVSVNVILQVAKTTTTVTVTTEAPLIQAENGDVSATMDQKQISEVPNPGNDLTYIVQTTPGVVTNTDLQGSANFSILGMPGTSYLYTMDGMNDNDNGMNYSLAGTLFLLLGQNQIQESTVVSTGYSGQFGGAAVTFEPGARSAWHTHPCGQTLIVIAGLGWTQCWGEPKAEIRPGDVITCPPGKKTFADEGNRANRWRFSSMLSLRALVITKPSSASSIAGCKTCDQGNLPYAA